MDNIKGFFKSNPYYQQKRYLRCSETGKRKRFLLKSAYFPYLLKLLQFASSFFCCTGTIFDVKLSETLFLFKGDYHNYVLYFYFY
jgi:hypothetical protein